MENKQTHPGVYIRQSVIPQEMTVTAAAKFLRIGRPALSTVLNGNASLSPKLAHNIEAAFGTSAKTLLRMQAEYDAASVAAATPDTSVSTYVPPYLQIGHKQIETWASTIVARSQLSVLVRTLVRSSGKGLTHTDFPGHDASQSPGWDGLVEASESTAWVPVGRSGWEMGCGQDPQKKANDDYRSRTERIEALERREMVFVFVTARRWSGKDRWVNQRRAENQWKDVRAYDASDLEQWLEQSIAGQLWFAETTGQPTEGLVSLGQCWHRWQAGSKLPLGPCIFDDEISHSKKAVEQWFQAGPGTTLSVGADSNGEALAFLYALFLERDGVLSPQGQKVVVFEQTGLLGKLLRPGADLVPVITSRDLELEVAEHLEYCKPIILQNRVGSRADHDIVLEPMYYGAFCTALESLGWDTDSIERYRRESGRSRTVLRRRLSPLPAVRTPEWATSAQLTRLMAPIALAGSWDHNSEFDRLFLSELAGGRSPEDIEEDFGDLLRCPDPPVWRIGSNRGVTSRIDALFTVLPTVTDDHLRRYFEVAVSVLSEDDPAVDLPDEERWLADLHGKRRGCSQALRLGITETLVLLSVFHDELFRTRPGFETQDRVDRLVRDLLDPFIARTLESQTDHLPAYAEAAPETFLDLIEKDLDRGADSELLSLLRPIESDMASCPRLGLLEALETLAWSGSTLARTVDILAKLANYPIDDLWTKTPESCLEAIFRSWLPQTSVGIKGRIQVFERLAQAAPEVAWRLSCNQLKPGMRAGEYNAKPRWRKDGDGFGQRSDEDEDQHFQLFCRKYLLTRDRYSRQELADLVGLLRWIPDSPHAEVWELIDRWRHGADEQDKASLRDRIRYEWLRSRPAKFRKHPQEPENIKRALAAYASLEPSDPVLKYRWLFNHQQWQDEHDVPQDRILGCDRPGESALATAVAEVYSQTGANGILHLASSVDDQVILGRHVASLDLGIAGLCDLIQSAIEGEFGGDCDGLVGALLEDLNDAFRAELYSELRGCLSSEGLGDVLRLAPFRRDTWRTVETLGDSYDRDYWRSVDPRGAERDPAELDEAVERFMVAGRTIDALWLAARRFEMIDAKRLYRVLAAVASYTGSEREQLFSNASIVNDIGRAIARLRESHQIAGERMAVLELRLFDALHDYGSHTPDLDTLLTRDARLYSDLVDCASQIDESGQDGDTVERVDPPVRIENRIAWLVLEERRFLPGTSGQEPVSAERVLAWIRQARELCDVRGKRKGGDYWIGRLLSAAGTGTDGVWPCEAARDALELISNDDVNSGFQNGIYGSGGYRASGFQGAEEKGEAEQHARWSEALQYSHPKVSSLLDQVAKEFRSMSEAIVQDRSLFDQLLNSK